MRVLILVSCVIAAASAGFVHSPAAVAYTTGYVGYTGAHHVPVIGANGVPVEPAENQAARAAHAAAHVEAKARNGDVVVGPAVAYTAYPAATYAAYAQHVPVIGANGVPVEPVANQAARAAHAAAHVEAKARNGDVTIVGPAVTYAAYPTTVVTAAGVAETPEVVAAKAAHFKAHAEAKARNLGVAVGYAAPYSGYNTVYGYSYPYYGTAIGANGVPLEPAENVAARAAHAAAHIEAKVRNGVLVRRRRGFASTYYSPYSYAAVPAVTYAGAQHVPVIGANGVPVEPAANQAARAAHAAAHVEAVARNGDAAVVVGAPTVYAAGHAFYAGAQHVPVIGANGVPVEPVANQAARAAHAVAHVEAKARNGDVVVAPAVAYSTYPAVAYTTGAVGVPADTPEVAAAKAAHFQAHVNAKIAAGVY